jgi:hypothetical protein
MDPDGDPITSCVVVSTEVEAKIELFVSKGRGRTTVKRECDDPFTRACLVSGQIICIRADGPKVKAVELERLLEAAWRLLGGSVGNTRSGRRSQAFGQGGAGAISQPSPPANGFEI